MKAGLKNFADVRAGYPFRGRVPEMPEEKTLVVQMRDVDASDGISWKYVVKTLLKGRKAPDWLQEGDILFIARGSRNFAVCVENLPGRAVCSQYFFVIRIKNCAELLPAFLVWQINQFPAQNYFTMHAEGTDQPSIRRSVLEALPLVVPPLSRQQQLIVLDQAVRQERTLLEGLIRNRAQQMQQVALNLLADFASPAFVKEEA